MPAVFMAQQHFMLANAKVFRKDLKEHRTSKNRCQDIGKYQNSLTENIIYDLIGKFRSLACFFFNFLLVHILFYFLAFLPYKNIHKFSNIFTIGLTAHSEAVFAPRFFQWLFPYP